MIENIRGVKSKLERTQMDRIKKDENTYKWWVSVESQLATIVENPQFACKLYGTETFQTKLEDMLMFYEGFVK
jgi:hypothetical protein